VIDGLAARSIDVDYLVGDVLGSGGMGIVYSATQLSLGRRVAIKLPRAELAADPRVLRRFRTEALAGGRLDHDNIARVIDSGRGGAPFLVMEYIAGTPLDEIVTKGGALELRVATNLCGQLLAALEEAHKAGIIHADVKSGNVLIETLESGELLARLIDFGLARFSTDANEPDDRLLSGTPEYLAPELVQGGPPTVASDLYAAGVVLYELLTGTTPFAGGTAGEIVARQVDDAVVPPSLRCPEQAIRAPSELSVGDSPQPQAMRRAIAEAITACDGDAIITSYLELVRLLIDGHQLAAAATELEYGIELLRPLMALSSNPPALWRLQLCLAALYSGLSDPARARIAARRGLDDAIRAASVIGQDRARELLGRLARYGAAVA
jgi:serine/threonine protein kinase